MPDNVDLPEDVDLQGVVLSDARTGDCIDLGAGLPLVVLTVIRHRH